MIAILAIMLLIVGNTIAMGVRERTYEYGVLKALGFRFVTLDLEGFRSGSLNELVSLEKKLFFTGRTP